jgi:hypothetical protein
MVTPELRRQFQSGTWRETVVTSRLHVLTSEKAKQRRKLALTPVGVEKVRDRNVFSGAMIAAAEFFLLTSAKKPLP